MTPTSDATDRDTGCSPESAGGRAAAKEAGRRRLATRAAADQDALKPIGTRRLKALRKAIQSGSYPRDADVAEGLVRMFRKPEGRSRKKRS